MRISFLCNSFLALPSAQFLFKQGVLAGLATSSANVLLSRQAAFIAREMEVPFTTITKKNLESDLTRWVQDTSAEAVVVQTFPFRIPASCLNLPTQGFFNLHPSSLPAYRGPDPIFWQLANNESTSGITLHKMEEDFDTGPVFHIESIPINTNDTYGHLHSNLSFAALEALKVFLSEEEPSSKLTSQPSEGGSHQSTPGPEHLIIDWKVLPAEKVQALIRACNPNQNGAITFFRGVITRILEVSIYIPERIPELPPGSIIAADEIRGLQILCADQKALKLKILHVEEGYYSGKRFCEVFEVALGEKFCGSSFLS